MSTVCTNVIKTLTAGETFVLPAGATLIGVTDTSAISSTDCKDLEFTTLLKKRYHYRWHTDCNGDFGSVESWGHFKKFVYGGNEYDVSGGYAAVSFGSGCVGGLNLSSLNSLGGLLLGSNEACDECNDGHTNWFVTVDLLDIPSVTLPYFKLEVDLGGGDVSPLIIPAYLVETI